MKTVSWAFASLITSLLFGVLGYHTNSLLSRDNVSVLDVRTLAKKQPLTLDPQQVTFVQSCASQAQLLQMRPLGFPMSYRSGVVPHAFAQSFVEELHRLRHGFSLFASQAAQQVNQSDQDSKRLQDCEDAIESVLDAASSLGTIRTGEIELVVTFLNSGDTDGIVRPEGTINIEGIGDSLVLGLAWPDSPFPAQTPFAGIYSRLAPTSVTVSKRSLQTAMFHVIESRSPEEAMNDLEKRVLKDDTLSFKLQFEDIRGPNVVWEGKSIRAQ